MNKKQYNTIIDWTIKHERSTQNNDSLENTRAVLNNMGVALPQGDCKNILEILSTNDYMGWRSCALREAQQSANNGVAAIGISEQRIILFAAVDEEQPVAQTACVMTLSENTYANEISDLQYYSYGYGSTTADSTTTFPLAPPEEDVQPPQPHGNYLTFTCTHPSVCNDGIGYDYDDKHHQGQTAYMNGILNADIHRYIVIPASVEGFAALKGCVGVAVRSNGTYVFGIVGDVGNEKEIDGELTEFSVKMIQDLGFYTDGAYSVDPEEPVTTYIFPETRRSSWDSDTFNSDAETVGRQYFY